MVCECTRRLQLVTVSAVPTEQAPMPSCSNHVCDSTACSQAISGEAPLIKAKQMKLLLNLIEMIRAMYGEFNYAVSLMLIYEMNVHTLALDPTCCSNISSAGGTYKCHVQKRMYRLETIAKLPN